jgi:hypothetical protein
MKTMNGCILEFDRDAIGEDFGGCEKLIKEVDEACRRFWQQRGKTLIGWHEFTNKRIAAEVQKTIAKRAATPEGAYLVAKRRARIGYKKAKTDRE